MSPLDALLGGGELAIQPGVLHVVGHDRGVGDSKLKLRHLRLSNENGLFHTVTLTLELEGEFLRL